MKDPQDVGGVSPCAAGTACQSVSAVYQQAHELVQWNHRGRVRRNNVRAFSCDCGQTQEGSAFPPHHKNASFASQVAGEETTNKCRV